MRESPFLVNIATLVRNPGSVLDEHRRGRLEGLRVSSAAVPDGADVGVQARLEAVHEGIMAHAFVTAPWVGECRRCLLEARGEVRAEVRELFARGGDPEETYPLRGDQLDLAPLARDAVLLELPVAPLCNEACQGLCPNCGANRNETECGCEAETSDPRWAALDALRND